MKFRIEFLQISSIFEELCQFTKSRNSNYYLFIDRYKPGYVNLDIYKKIFAKIYLWTNMNNLI